MTDEESFYEAWLNTREKALDLFSGISYFPEGKDTHTYDACMQSIKDYLLVLFSDSIIGINAQNHELFFQNLNLGITKIKAKVVENYANETWVDFPFSLLNNIQSYLFANFTSIFKNKSITINPNFDKFTILLSSWATLFSSKKNNYLNFESEELFKELTEQNVKRMVSEFNIASFQIMDHYSWYANFVNTQHIYNAIKHSQKRIGLPFENLGAGERLNIVISERFLDERKWLGIQSKTNASFSIFINPIPNDIQITWAHEYTHFLDRLAAHVYFKQNESEEEISSFSHLALNYVVNQQTIKNKSLKIVAETMSAAIGGVSAEEFGIKITNSIKAVKENITLKIIIEALPEKEITWDNLSLTERQILLNKCRISELTEFIMLEISNYPNATFGLSANDTVISIEGHKQTDSKIFVPDIITNIIDKVKDLDQFAMHTNLLEYLKLDLAHDVKIIMNQHNLVIYKDHSSYGDRFFLSPGNMITQNAQNKNTSKYQVLDYDKPLELLARMSENLQTPLLNNYEYNNLENKTKTDFMNPILGKEERMMLCAAFHSMASYVGINVIENVLEHLPCVIPNNVDIDIDMSLNDPFDFIYANPNQIVPDENRRKIILQNIEKIKENNNDFSQAFQNNISK